MTRRTCPATGLGRALKSLHFKVSQSGIWGSERTLYDGPSFLEIKVDPRMANSDAALWPKTADGTTDWEVVFEAPEGGFIALIAQSPSAETLRLTTTVLIDKLFTRRGDQVEVKRLKQQLEVILAAPDEIPAKQTGVTELLREIKNTRLEKARVYIERKNSGAAIDRRAGLLWKIDALLKPKVLIPVGLVFIALVSSLVFILLQTTLGPGRPVQMAEAPVSAQAPTAAPTVSGADEAQPPAAPEPRTEPTASEPEIEAPRPPVGPIRIFLKVMRWPLSSLSATDRPQYYGAVLSVRDWDTKVAVCRRVAPVMDRLYQAFNKVLPQDKNATAAQLAEVERIGPNILNQIFKLKLVDEIKVYPYGQAGFQVAKRPPYCTSPDSE